MLSPGDCSPVMVVLAHPRTGSLCHRLARRAVESIMETGAEATLHDLYAEGFDPVLLPDEVWQTNLDSALLTDDDRGVPRDGGVDPMVSRHRWELERSHALVVIHPDWWGKPPAILSGWVDRVLVPVWGTPDVNDPHTGGTDERPTEVEGLQRVLVINTAGDRASDGADPLGLTWREGVGRRLPTTELERMSLRGGADVTADQVDRWLIATDRAARWVAGAPR
ncbi:NAD(P)H-dependent oxidoreductase [Microlunatus sp. Y2014]|uniref:NAD(P)H-dependent oxidoreductase n=1 Tax=Microlunatus sp. Y2014 TaxID=3418488 RepID=UPI003DA77FB4